MNTILEYTGPLADLMKGCLDLDPTARPTCPKWWLKSRVSSAVWTVESVGGVVGGCNVCQSAMHEVYFQHYG